MLFFSDPKQLLAYLRLTDRQQQYVKVIACYTAENGYPPSYRDMMVAMKATSPTSGRYTFLLLQNRGLMAHPAYKHASRSSCLIGITWRQVDLGSGRTA